jgi:phage regulator Rha-like protein
MEWLGAVGVVTSLVVLGFNVAMFIVIKFNDFAHMEKALSEIKAKQEVQNTKLDAIAERTASIEGTCKIACLKKIDLAD